MKKLTSLVLTLLLLVSLAVPSMAYTTVLSTQNLMVDGKPINCERYNIDGYNYFKLRDLAWVLNGTGSQFDVDYDTATQTMVVTTGQPYTHPNQTELVIGADNSASAVPTPQTLMIDGVVRSDLSAYNIADLNYFKLADLGKALGFDVSYDETTRTMVVASRTAQVPTPTPVQTGERTELNSEQIYARCVPAVIYIEVYDEYGDVIGTGSGFFIDGNGTAVTNHHVIRGATSAKVWLADSSGADQEERDVLGVYDWNEEEDWAILKVDITGNSWLTLGDSNTAHGGATVYTLGSPQGLSASIDDGMVSNPTRVIDGQTYIQHSASMSPGSSGGALVNKYGEVIGITNMILIEEYSQNINFAIPIEKIVNAKHGELTPITETYVIPRGVIYPAERFITLHPGETFDNVITATKSNTDELLTVDYDIDDTNIVSCKWDSWTADDTEVTLHMTAGNDYGTTIVYIYLYTTDSWELLDYDWISVEVVGGEVAPEVEEVTLDKGSSTTIWVAASADDGRSVRVTVDDNNTDILSCAWGNWNEAQDHVPLTINALAYGSYGLTLELIDGKTDAVLATNYLYVTVVGGKLTISEEEFMMSPGETKTVTITGAANDPSLQAFIHADEFDSEVIDWQRGQLGTGTVQLTIKALAEGWDCIYITLEDADGNVLVDGWIDVYVNMDGRDPNELD